MTQPMTQQQPFESGEAIMQQREQLQLAAIDNQPEPHTRMTRHEKLEFLDDTTHFRTKNPLLMELVSWMTDDDFNQFYEDFCSNWDICRSYEELHERYGE